MSFFDSEIVRAEVAQVQKIQEEIMVGAVTYPTMTSGQKIILIDKMHDLLDKQKVLHARIKLSDASEAKDMLDKMKQTAYSLGIPRDTSIEDLFSQMEQVLKQMKINVERTA
mgnify:CR=1 FL=1|jgi:hypothetical protein